MIIPSVCAVLLGGWAPSAWSSSGQACCFACMLVGFIGACLFAVRVGVKTALHALDQILRGSEHLHSPFVLCLMLIQCPVWNLQSSGDLCTVLLVHAASTKANWSRGFHVQSGFHVPPCCLTAKWAGQEMLQGECWSLGTSSADWMK